MYETIEENKKIVLWKPWYIKTREIESSGKLVFLFWQIRRKEVKRLCLMNKKNIFLIVKKYAQFSIIPFQTLS